MNSLPMLRFRVMSLKDRRDAVEVHGKQADLVGDIPKRNYWREVWKNLDDEISDLENAIAFLERKRGR